MRLHVSFIVLVRELIPSYRIFPVYLCFKEWLGKKIAFVTFENFSSLLAMLGLVRK